MMTTPRGLEHVTHTPVGIERERRDLMANQPELYRYIENVTSAKVLDSAADQALGASDVGTAAHRMWSLAGQCRQDADRQRAEAAAREREEGE